MEQKYNEFLKISWTDNKEWQLYFSNLVPTPPGNRVEHYKKKFYRLKIDNTFDITYQPPTTTNQNNTSSYNPYNNQSFTQSIYRDTIFNKLAALIETILFIVFIGLSIGYHKYTIWCGSAAIFIRLIRRVGRPRFNIVWAQDLFLDEHFQLFLACMLMKIDRLNLFSLLPIYITAILNIFDYLRFVKVFYKIANLIINKRVILSDMRGQSEIGIGFFLIIGVFVGTNFFLLPIFYWQYLRFKYIVNQDCSNSFAKLNMQVDSFKSGMPKPIKFVITKMQQGFSFLGKTESKPGKAAGGANCMVY